MLKAKDIMEKDVISVTPDTDITRAGEMLLKNHINGMPVVDNENRLIGILCQSDLIFQQKEVPLPPIFVLLDGIFPLASSKRYQEALEKSAAITVEKAMVKDPVAVDPDMPIPEIAKLMVERHFHTIPVVEADKVVGVIGKEDILKVLISKD
ncbi:MAG: CBS domain-containing protein [Desulfobacteraceae bacterium]|nr:MAG: CBS domain-containing protein [Desulfobacteraceae bacterium]